MKVKDQILERAAEYGHGKIFNVEQLFEWVDASARRNTVLKAVHDLKVMGVLRSPARGLYYLPVQLDRVCADIPESHEYSIEYLWLKRNGENIGYISGQYLAAELGFQTLVPAKISVYTNEWRLHRELCERYNVSLVKPRVVVTRENFRELAIIDSLENQNAFDCENLDKQVSAACRDLGIDLELLRYLLLRHYPEKTKSRLEELEVFRNAA